MNKTLTQVEEFHKKFNHPVSDIMTVVDRDLGQLRHDLILEEFKEYMVAIKEDDYTAMIDALCDLRYVINGAVLVHGLQDIFDKNIELFDEQYGTDNAKTNHPAILMKMSGLIGYYFKNSFEKKHGVLTALTHLSYSLDSIIKIQGFDEVFEECFDEVQRSNMSKLGEDGNPIYREDGKVMKGPNYSAPDLQSILDKDENKKWSASI